MELALRAGLLVAERRCGKSSEDRWPGICRICLHPGDVCEPPPGEAAALVLTLLDSFVVDGPKFTARDVGR